MPDLYTPGTKKLIDLHRMELLQDAARHRLLCQIRTSRAQALRQSVQVTVGRLLIAIGSRLLEPYKLGMVNCTERLSGEQA